MADIWTKEKRSEVMGMVRSRGNRSTEMRLIKIMRQNRIRGWLRRMKLPGAPDFVFRRERLVLFVDGCFWHGCPQHGRMPKQNNEFWMAKIARNIKRDRRVTKELRTKGWKVIRIWEHSLKKPGPLIARVKKALAMSAAASDSPIRRVRMGNLSGI